MTQITLSELPETIQTLLTQALKTGESLTITHNDHTIAIVSPVKKRTRSAFGAAKDTGKIVGDILEPSSNFITWDVLS